MKIATKLRITTAAGLLCACSMSVNKGMGFEDDDGIDVDDNGDDGGGAGGDDGGDGGDDGDDGGDESADACGDGVLSATEACDGTEFSETCKSLGFEEGELVCDAMCRFDSSGCFTCGNGEVEGPETCDGDVPEYASCASEGFTEGPLTCDVAACQLDTGECTLCGDDTREGNEECDGDELDGNTCVGMGYESGTLRCLSDTCALDLGSCVPFEFHANFEDGELGPEWTSSGSAAWILTDVNTITGGYSVESGEIVDYAASSISIMLEFTMDGELSFSHRESTEAGFDTLLFYVDGLEQASWSGITSARTEEMPITAGVHRLQWTYLKDSVSSAGEDKVWIDDIHAIGAVLAGG